MQSRGVSGKTSGAVRALIVEDDILVAAFIEGVLLDEQITADSIMMRDFRKYLLRRRYDVAVFGIDGKSDAVPTAVRLLQHCDVAVIFFSVLGDPHKLAAEFPDVPICHYDARYSGSLALKVSCAANTRTRSSSDIPAADGFPSIWQ